MTYDKGDTVYVDGKQWTVNGRVELPSGTTLMLSRNDQTAVCTPKDVDVCRDGISRRSVIRQ